MSILAVPLEIRQAVYSHLLVSNKGLKPWEKGVRRSRRTQYDLHPAILRTCRQIYDEAYSFLLNNNVFVHQTVVNYACTKYSYYLSDDPSAPLEGLRALPSRPWTLANIIGSDSIRHLELKCHNCFDKSYLLESVRYLALGCLLRTLKLELWSEWSQNMLAEPLDLLMRLEVSDTISITVLGMGPEQRDLTIKVMDRMLANGGDGWLYDVQSANLDLDRGDNYPFLPRQNVQAGEWVLVPRRERAGGTLTHLPNK